MSAALASIMHNAAREVVALCIRNGHNISKADQAFAGNVGFICFVVFASIGRSVIKNPKKTKKQ